MPAAQPLLPPSVRQEEPTGATTAASAAGNTAGPPESKSAPLPGADLPAVKEVSQHPKPDTIQGLGWKKPSDASSCSHSSSGSSSPRSFRGVGARPPDAAAYAVPGAMLLPAAAAASGSVTTAAAIGSAPVVLAATARPAAVGPARLATRLAMKAAVPQGAAAESAALSLPGGEGGQACEMVLHTGEAAQGVATATRDSFGIAMRDLPAVGPGAAADHFGKLSDKSTLAGSFISSLGSPGAVTAAGLHPGAAALPSAPSGHMEGPQSSPVAQVNPYARLDEGAPPAVLHASPQQMTVAIHDASLGSLQVQVQAVSGQLAANLTTASPSAHAQLSGHLASLTGYLQDQRVDLARVTVVQQSFLGMGGHPGSSGSPAQQGQGSEPSSSGAEEKSVRASAPAAISASSTGAHAVHAVADRRAREGSSFIDVHA